MKPPRTLAIDMPPAPPLGRGFREQPDPLRRMHARLARAPHRTCLFQVMCPPNAAGRMKARGKLGGQHKVPRIITDQELFDHLRQYTGAG